MKFAIDFCACFLFICAWLGLFTIARVFGLVSIFGFSFCCVLTLAILLGIVLFVGSKIKK